MKNGGSASELAASAEPAERRRLGLLIGAVSMVALVVFAGAAAVWLALVASDARASAERREEERALIEAEEAAAAAATAAAVGRRSTGVGPAGDFGPINWPVVPGHPLERDIRTHR